MNVKKYCFIFSRLVLVSPKVFKLLFRQNIIFLVLSFCRKENIDSSHFVENLIAMESLSLFNWLFIERIN